LEDLRFLEDFKPEMIGVGPFIPHQNTPFARQPAGDLTLTLKVVALARLLVPRALLPATTALATVAPNGRELALQAGANVAMPNLSPTATRELYELYDGRTCAGDEAAHCRRCIERRIIAAGYEVDLGRGDPNRGKL
jgi:biotin synthase